MACICRYHDHISNGNDNSMIKTAYATQLIEYDFLAALHVILLVQFLNLVANRWRECILDIPLNTASLIRYDLATKYLLLTWLLLFHHQRPISPGFHRRLALLAKKTNLAITAFDSPYSSGLPPYSNSEPNQSVYLPLRSHPPIYHSVLGRREFVKLQNQLLGAETLVPCFHHQGSSEPTMTLPPGLIVNPKTWAFTQHAWTFLHGSDCVELEMCLGHSCTQPQYLQCDVRTPRRWGRVGLFWLWTLKDWTKC